MARADLLVMLVKAMTNSNNIEGRKAVEKLIEEERGKGHRILAERLAGAMKPSLKSSKKLIEFASEASSYSQHKNFLHETSPKRSLNSLYLENSIYTQLMEFIHEQHRSDLLHTYGLRARNSLLLAGPPGNGKTTLAEALAYELMYPLYTVRYESLIGSYLGETSSRLKNMLDFIKTQRCVLFFDEFDTIAKERGDTHETGEIKRVVSSLLLQIDDLPDYVVIVVASNHPELLDRAVWRRFQLKFELSSPTRKQLEEFIISVSNRCDTDLGYSPASLAKYLYGLSFAEVEEFCLGVIRHSVLNPDILVKNITKVKLNDRHTQLKTP